MLDTLDFGWGDLARPGPASNKEGVASQDTRHDPSSLQQCLQKDRKRRLRDIGDARLDVDDVLVGASDTGVTVPPSAPKWNIPAMIGLCGLSVVLGGVPGCTEKEARHGWSQDLVQAHTDPVVAWSGGSG